MKERKNDSRKTAGAGTDTEGRKRDPGKQLCDAAGFLPRRYFPVSRREKLIKKEARCDRQPATPAELWLSALRQDACEGPSHCVSPCLALLTLHFLSMACDRRTVPMSEVNNSAMNDTCHRAYLSFLLLESQLLSLSLFLFRLCGLRLRSRLRHEHSPSRWLPPDCLESTEADRLSSLLRQKERSSASFNHWSPRQTSLEPSIL